MTINSEIASETSGSGSLRASPAVRFSFRVYQQVAAVFGAIGLAAVVGRFVNLDWQGGLATLFGLWGTVVRPAAAILCHIAITQPVHWALGWNMVVPLAWRDYLSAGAILYLSMWRVFGTDGMVELKRLKGAKKIDWTITILFSVTILLFWPEMIVFISVFAIPFTIFELVAVGPRAAIENLAFLLLVFSPFIYLLVAITINTIYLKHGTLTDVVTFLGAMYHATVGAYLHLLYLAVRSS